jgi:hypothetical protein
VDHRDSRARTARPHRRHVGCANVGDGQGVDDADISAVARQSEPTWLSASRRQADTDDRDQPAGTGCGSPATPEFVTGVLRSLPAHGSSRDLATTGCGDNRYDNPPGSRTMFLRKSGMSRARMSRARLLRTRDYAPWPAARGDFLFRAGRLAEARSEFTAAATLTRNERERAFLLARAGACDGKP